MATTTNQGFQRGFLLSDSKSQKPVEKRKKKTPVTKKASDGFQSGFLLDNRKTKTTANETKKPKSSPPAKSYGGFSRGFLNSAATKKKKVSTNDDVKQRKKEVVVVSQELLDIGDDGPSMREKKNPFFISSFEHNQNQAKDGKSTQKSPIHPRQPLISILQSDTTAQPEEKSPSPSLISVVDDDGANDVITHHSSQQPKAHDGKKERIINLNEQKTTNPLILEQQEEGERTPLWTEVTTRRRELGRFQEPLIGNNFQESSTVTIEQSIESNQTTSSKLPEDIPTNDILLDDKPSLFRFQQKLESLVWQLQQQHEKDQPSAFAKEWSPTHFSWAWEWAFGDGKQNAHRVHGRGTLAVSLFQSNPVSILSVVRSQTQAERVVTLKAVQFLQEFFSGQQQHQKNHLPCSRGTKWVKELVSTLLSLADQPRRTLLAQECWKSTVFILSSVCETIYNDAHEQNEREWIEPGMMEQLERILQLKLSWTLSKKKISAKDQVMISILDDWKRVNRTCQNKMTNTLWCEQLAGQSTRGYSHWGGLRQTLCSDDAISITTTTAETIEVAMTSGLQDEFQERSRLRGVLATVTAKKRNHHPLGRFVNVSLQMLAKTKAPETIDLLLSLL